MNTATDTKYDVAIVGGGLVGISLAYALGQLKPQLKVVLIEAYDYASLPPPGFDSRTVALSYSSRQIFDALNLWSGVADQACPISTIHISDRGHPGMTRLTADEQNVTALGYVIENRVLGECLFQHLSDVPGLSLLTNTRVNALTFNESSAVLEVATGTQSQTLHAALVIAADGSDSFVRQHLAINQRHWDYHQSAVIANIAVDRSHQNIAYERFTQSGPMALLPLPAFAEDKHRYGLVWTVPEKEVATVMQMDDETFAKELEKRFAQRMGKVTRVGKRADYPLGLTMISEHVRHRLAFIGNAAHTMHPVAGQGFNLGLRDVAAIVEVIKTALQQDEDIGALSTLQRYANWRSQDHKTTVMFTDALVRVFSNNFTPLVVARNLGLMAIDMFAPLRKRLTRHAMGYLGKASLLARGLGL